MRIQVKIAFLTIIVSVLVIVVPNVEYTLNHTPEEKLFFILQIPISIFSGLFVWYLVTRGNKKTRKYVRTEITRRYLLCLVISNALLQVPVNRSNIQNLMDDVSEHYRYIVDKSEKFSYFLDGDEIKRFVKEQRHLINVLAIRLIQTPDNEELLQEFYDYTRRTLSNYVKKHELNDFNRFIMRN